jgi:hypothetical protein
LIVAVVAAAVALVEGVDVIAGIGVAVGMGVSVGATVGVSVDIAVGVGVGVVVGLIHPETNSNKEKATINNIFLILTSCIMFLKR